MMPIWIFLCTVFVLLLVRRYSSNEASTEAPLTDIATENITPLHDFDVSKTEPRAYRPWSPGKFAMTMGLRKLPADDLFPLDKEYIKEQEFRRYLLTEKREAVVQVLSGTEEACVEVLESIVDFVTKRYPHLFVFIPEKPGYLHNRITDLLFKVNEPYEAPPLEVAAQLVMEDLNVLVQGAGKGAEDDPDQHYLRASFSMAPAGWYLQERIGWPLWKIHTPVPMWEEKLRKPIERFLINLKVGAPIQRNNFFMQPTPEIFQQEPFAVSFDSPPTIEDLILRHERQTLRRLPKTKAVLFTVRTYFTPVTVLAKEPESLRGLLDSAKAMPEDMARYKGRDMWLETVEKWASSILKENDCGGGNTEMEIEDQGEVEFKKQSWQRRG